MNLSIALVDDEMIERKAMRKIIEDHFGKTIICGEAANGRQAIQLADEKRPNIMLMDIKMPGIDGLEAIERIKEKHPDIKFIMISAYDSFDYAKQAMKKGVKEYILKPATKEETIQAILNVYREIAEEQMNQERKKYAAEIAKKHFLQQIMDQNITKDLQTIKQEYFPTMKAGFFLVIDLEREEEREILSKKITETYRYSIIQEKSRAPYIIFIMSEDPIDKAEVLRFVRMLFLTSSGKKWMGIGGIYEQLQDFPRSFNEALLALGQLKMQNRDGYGFPTHTEAAVQEILKEILDCLLQNDVIRAINHVKQTDEENLQRLYVLIKQNLLTKGIDIQNCYINNSKSMSEWESFLQQCSLYVQQFYRSQGYVERAKQYIWNHYNELLTLERVAEKVKLSPPYFAKIFKEETGKTFVDYVTELRLEKAKELLLQNQLSFKEISFAVGYRDPNYFSRVFKKYFHMSPREFRNIILKK